MASQIGELVSQCNKDPNNFKAMIIRERFNTRTRTRTSLVDATAENITD